MLVGMEQFAGTRQWRDIASSLLVLQRSGGDNYHRLCVWTWESLCLFTFRWEVEWQRQRLRALPADAAGELNVLRHDRHALSFW